MTKDDEISEIRKALMILVDAILDHRSRRAETSAGSLEGLGAFVLPETEAQAAAAGILRDPVGASLRRSVTVLGERLHELGGLKAMQDAADEVASVRGESQYGLRVGIMDRRWDGIGEGKGSSGWRA